MMQHSDTTMKRRHGQGSPNLPEFVRTESEHERQARRTLVRRIPTIPKSIFMILPAIVSSIITFVLTNKHPPFSPIIKMLNPPGLAAQPHNYQNYLKCLEDPACTTYPKRNNSLPHDYPGHPWHWAREHEPDPVLSKKKDCKGSLYKDLYDEFHLKGVVIFESCSLKKNKTRVLDPARAFTANLTEQRRNSAKEKAVKLLAVDPDTLEFMEYLHAGRRIFPYQTLNFPHGSEQPLHSDLIHADTSPRTLLSAAWVALEDMNANNGPLRYVPGTSTEHVEKTMLERAGV